MTVVLVTGATRGLGKEAARRLVLEGCTVYLGARDDQRGTAAAEDIHAIPIALDVTDDASVAAAMERIGTEAGGLDVLVNNAGISGEQRPPGEATVDDLRDVLETNLLGVERTTRAAVRLLQASANPVVVMVSSRAGSLALAADHPPFSLVAYPVSKAGVNMLTLQYAAAFPRWRVNAVTPGRVATEFGGGVNTPDSGAKTVEQGAEVIVRMALLGPEGPTGTFASDEGPVAW